MQFEDIEYIKTLYELRNVSRAADALFISQPGLSKIIKRLEVEFGTPLFIRGKNELQPTKACEIFLAQGEKILENYAYLKTRIQNLCDVESGTLKIGTSVLFSKQYFPEIFKTFHNNHPNVTLDVYEMTSSELENALNQKKIELAIFPLPFSHPEYNFDYEELCTSETLFAVNKNNHILKNMKSHLPASTDTEAASPYVDLSDFKDEPFILLKPDQRIRQLSDIVLAEAGVTPHVVLESRFSDIVNQMVQWDNGVGFLSSSCVKLPDVEYCHINSPMAARVMVAAYSHNSELSNLVRLFINVAKLICENSGPE